MLGEEVLGFPQRPCWGVGTYGTRKGCTDGLHEFPCKPDTAAYQVSLGQQQNLAKPQPEKSNRIYPYRVIVRVK